MSDEHDYTSDRRTMENNRHTYPSVFPPGSHWAVTRGWEIVDLVTPGVLSDQARAMLCGAIAAALMKVAVQGAPKNG